MRKILIIGIVLVAVYFVSCTAIVTTMVADDVPTGNVAVIPITGVITLGSSAGGFDYDFVKRSIQDANERFDVDAIVLSVNSPGGAAVASEEIGRLVKESEKPTVAWIREVGASGAYWISTNSDHIIANRMSITGSIGVVGSYLDFSEFLDRYNVTYQRLVSGEYKDAGSPFKELTPEERSLIQSKIDKIHEYFVEEVAQNRGLTVSQVDELATGIIYLGSEAKDLGLVDELGGEQEVKAYLEKILEKDVEFAYYRRDATVRDILGLNTRSNIIELPQGIQLR